MEIKSTLTNPAGQPVTIAYKDIESEIDLESKVISGVHAYCFYNDKLVVAYSGAKGCWTPAGGSVESGESAQDAVVREVKEETNMRVLKHRFIGLQEITEPDKVAIQTRSVCIVEPYDDFVADPDGEITKIELIDSKDYKEYFDWGEIGDHLMRRALLVKEEWSAAKS